MTWSERWFIIFLLINAIITIAYLIISIFFRKINRHLAYFRTVVMLLAPGIGALLLFLGWFGYKFIFRKDVDLSDVIFSKERGRETIRTNEDRERNIVPLEEAIAVSDKTELRNLVMGVAQGDYSESLSAISLALNSEDSETAHYAASVLQDTLNGFRINVQKGYSEVQKRNENIEYTAVKLIKYMNSVLVQNVFTDIEQRFFVHILENSAQILFEEKPEAITPDIYEMICLILLGVKDFDRCELWCRRSREAFPNTLSSYTSILKLYFNSGRREDFFATLDELKSSSVIIDKETLELIRAFQ